MSTEDFIVKLEGKHDINEKLEFILNSGIFLNPELNESLTGLIDEMIRINHVTIPAKLISGLFKLLYRLKQSSIASTIPYLREVVREKIVKTNEYNVIISELTTISDFLEEKNDESDAGAIKALEKWVLMFTSLEDSLKSDENYNSSSSSPFNTDKLVTALNQFYSSNDEAVFFATSLYSFLLSQYDNRIKNIVDDLSKTSIFNSLVGKLVSFTKDSFFFKMNPDWWPLIREAERKYHMYNLRPITNKLECFHQIYKGDEPVKDLTIELMFLVYTKDESLFKLLFNETLTLQEQELRKVFHSIISFCSLGDFFERSTYSFYMYFSAFIGFFRIIDKSLDSANFIEENIKDLKVLELETNLLMLKALIISEPFVVIAEEALISEHIINILNDAVKTNLLSENELIELIKRSPLKYDNLLTWMFITKIYCLHCNKELEKGTEICPNCGKAIEKEEVNTAIEFSFSSVSDLLNIEEQLESKNINKLDININD